LGSRASGSGEYLCCGALDRKSSLKAQSCLQRLRARPENGAALAIKSGELTIFDISGPVASEE
jgi:hypothetical protein